MVEPEPALLHCTSPAEFGRKPVPEIVIAWPGVTVPGDIVSVVLYVGTLGATLPWLEPDLKMGCTSSDACAGCAFCAAVADPATFEAANCNWY